MTHPNIMVNVTRVAVLFFMLYKRSTTFLLKVNLSSIYDVIYEQSNA